MPINPHVMVLEYAGGYWTVTFHDHRNAATLEITEDELVKYALEILARIDDAQRSRRLRGETIEPLFTAKDLNDKGE